MIWYLSKMATQIFWSNLSPKLAQNDRNLYLNPIPPWTGESWPIDKRQEKYFQIVITAKR